MGRIPTETEQTFNLEVGAWLKRERKRVRLSQRKLALALGVHRNTIDRWEHGEAVPLWAYTHLVQRFGYALRVMPAERVKTQLREVA